MLQHDVAAEVAHAPITLAVLIEGGGRSQAVNKVLSRGVPFLLRPLADALVRDDNVGTFAYTDTVRGNTGPRLTSMPT
jgi:hypothetical protein